MNSPGGWRVLVCVNRRLGPESPSCAARGSESLATRLEAMFAARGLDLPVERMLCFGSCSHGPNIRLAPGGAFFQGVTETDLPALVEQIAATVTSKPPGAC